MESSYVFFLSSWLIKHNFPRVCAHINSIFGISPFVSRSPSINMPELAYWFAMGRLLYCLNSRDRHESRLHPGDAHKMWSHSLSGWTIKHYFTDSKDVFTYININHGVFLEFECAAYYLKVTVLTSPFLWDAGLSKSAKFIYWNRDKPWDNKWYKEKTIMKAHH